MKYSVATNWDNQLVNHIKKLNKENKDKIFQIFGALAFSIFGSARSVPRVKDIPVKKVEKNIKAIKKAGLNFNYLVNSSVFPNLRKKENYDGAIEYFQWIEKLKPHIVTIANEKTLDFVYRNFPKLNVNISIVMAIKDPKKAERLFKKYKNIKGITLHQSVNRDLEKLKKHIKIAHKYRIKVELLANEICLYKCPRMKEHYAYLGRVSQLGFDTHTEFEIWCDKIRGKNPIEFLNACWIRPEDVDLYEKLGVDILKIAGRGETTEYLKKVTKFYMERKSPKNIMELFYPNWWTGNKKPFVDKEKLDGFIKYLWDRNLKKLKTISKKYNIIYKFKKN